MGIPTRVIGSIQDISERVETKKILETQNRRLREIFWTQSHKGRSLLANIIGLVFLISSHENNTTAINEVLPLI